MQSYLNEKYFISRRTAKNNFRQSIFKAWDYKCAYCGASANTLDHVHPKSKGGSNLSFNLVPCCLHCNLAKGSTELKTWFREQDFYSPKREAKITCWHQRLFIGADGSEYKTS